ncbi:hypothetical protein HUX53_05815 [Actinomadura sp. BRA 177]|nr:hypothetical protein [Actinomadura sp. BRA 177]
MAGPPPIETPKPSRRRTNRLAIVALVTGLAGMVPLAAGFAIAALVQTGRRAEKGRGLAIGALAASAAWAVAVAAVAVAMADGSSSSAERVQTRASALREGDCFTGAAIKGTDLVTVVPCTQPHENEVIARSAPPEEPYPGPEKLYLRAKELCTNRALYLQKSRYHENLDPRLLGPDQKRWWKGDRNVICLAHYTGAAGKLITPLARTIDPRLKLYNELAVGDCAEDFSEDRPVTTTVPCNEPHRSQVFAARWISLDAEYAPGDFPPYPGPGAIEKKAIRFCAGEARKLFARHPPPVDVRQQYAAPSEQDWQDGIQAIVCLARPTKPLNRSLLPK